MKRLILLTMLLQTGMVFSFPEQTNTASVTVGADAGHAYKQWRWQMEGWSDQRMIWTLDQDLSAYSFGFKMARPSATGQVSYVSLSSADTNNLGVTSTVVTVTLSYTNVPPDADYKSELICWSSNTNQVRVVGRGMIEVTESIYDDDDGTFPWPSGTNLTAYMTGAEITNTFISRTAFNISESTSNAWSNTTQTLVLNTNYLTIGSTNYINEITSGDGITVANGTGPTTTISIGSSAISNSMLAGSITGDKISSGEISNAHLAADAVHTTNIIDGTIAEADLNIVDSAADEDFLTYESTTGDFEWHSAADVAAAIGGALSEGELADSIVVSADIKNGTVANEDLAGGITDDKLSLTNYVTLNGKQIITGEKYYTGLAAIIISNTAPSILFRDTSGAGLNWMGMDDDILFVSGDFRIGGYLNMDGSNVTNLGHIYPIISNQYDLGSAALPWRTGYFAAATVMLGDESWKKTDAQNAKTAFGWGNHATNGYGSDSNIVTVSNTVDNLVTTQSWVTTSLTTVSNLAEYLNTTQQWLKSSLATVSNDLDTAESLIVNLVTTQTWMKSSLATVSNDLDTVESEYFKKDGSLAMSGDLNFGGNDATNLGDIYLDGTSTTITNTDSISINAGGDIYLETGTGDLYLHSKNGSGDIEFLGALANDLNMGQNNLTNLDRIIFDGGSDSELTNANNLAIGAATNLTIYAAGLSLQAPLNASWNAGSQILTNYGTPTADDHVIDKGYADGAYLNESSNLSDLDDAATARTNLSLVVGTDVEAHDTTLTDIADGTIVEDLVNTNNPWADNEVADTLTIGSGSSIGAVNGSSITNLAGGNIASGNIAADRLTNALSSMGGDAITWSGTDFDFDGGATPGGELGGTWASPTIDDDALDDQYYDSEADLTGLLNDNYLQISSNLSDLNSAAVARTNLDLVIGTDVQGYDAQLDEWANISTNAGVDEANLDVSVNASLDLADSSVQPGDPIETLDSSNSWRVFYSDGSSNLIGLALGTSGQVFTAQGSAAAPVWAAGGSGTDSALDNRAATADVAVANFDVDNVDMIRMITNSAHEAATANEANFYIYNGSLWIVGPSGVTNEWELD